MMPFLVAVFLSAFLLFLIQPLVGKYLLPWFGGAPALWSTVVLFFQVLLTGGYAYADWLIGGRDFRRAAIRHALLLSLSLVLLLLLGVFWPSPVTPAPVLRPHGLDAPIPGILAILLLSVGLPYFALAANGPLMQAWFSRSFPKRPYAPLYALSNAGSLLGLLAYPALIEPVLSLRAQGWWWSAGFAVFVGLSLWVLVRRGPADSEPGPDAPTERRIEAAQLGLSAALSATASIFLLAVTNHVTQDIAPFPLLWTLPLAAYLLSFIGAFAGRRVYDRRTYALLFGLVSLAALMILMDPAAVSAWVQIAVYVFLLFLGCMICHGELYALRPPAADLTTFYLSVAAGGAAGGIFVGFVAPAIFAGFWELYLAWILVIVILIVVRLPHLRERPPALAAAVLVPAAAVTLALALALNHAPDELYRRRDFYGVLRVRELQTESGQQALALIHGATVHGMQYSAPELRAVPTTYFVEDSGVGLALQAHPARDTGMRVGVLGLGAGTLAAYGRPGDQYFFYELSPAVIDLARGEGGYFSFLRDSRAEITIVPGDARLSLEDQLASGGGMRFDVLVLDVFSSDSIPVHLLTREAMVLYLEHLGLDGILAAHVSNRHLDLEPVVRRLAREFDLTLARVDRPFREGEDASPSEWLLLARDPALLQAEAIRTRTAPSPAGVDDVRLWTDDYSSLLEVLR